MRHMPQLGPVLLVLLAAPSMGADNPYLLPGPSPSPACSPSPAAPPLAPPELRLGGGTPNQLVKWLDDGTLGDSAVTEVDGWVALGPGQPGQKLHIGDGNVLIEGGDETALKFKRDITYRGGPSGTSVNPIFEMGRIIQAGDGDPEFRFLYSDDCAPERTVLEFDRKGIVASVKTDRGSHFEGFLTTTDPEPVFRLNSYPKMRLEMGTGGTFPVDVAVQREAESTLTLITDNAERLRIDKEGHVGIGTTSPGYALQVNGTVAAHDFVTPSDARLKQNVEPLSDALARVLAVRGVSFEWRDRTPGSATARHLGVLAQELLAVLPEAVRADGGGHFQVSYTTLIPLLLEALKEEHHRSRRAEQDTDDSLARLIRRIDHLETENARLGGLGPATVAP